MISFIDQAVKDATRPIKAKRRTETGDRADEPPGRGVGVGLGGRNSSTNFGKQQLKLLKKRVLAILIKSI
jgi:hypothetical protein